MATATKQKKNQTSGPSLPRNLTDEEVLHMAFDEIEQEPSDAKVATSPTFIFKAWTLLVAKQMRSLFDRATAAAARARTASEREELRAIAEKAERESIEEIAAIEVEIEELQDRIESIRADAESAKRRYRDCINAVKELRTDLLPRDIKTNDAQLAAEIRAAYKPQWVPLASLKENLHTILKFGSTISQPDPRCHMVTLCLGDEADEFVTQTPNGKYISSDQLTQCKERCQEMLLEIEPQLQELEHQIDAEVAARCGHNFWLRRFGLN